jgi:DcmR-like sensory protein
MMGAARHVHPNRESPATHVNWLELDRAPHAIQFYSGDGFLLDSLSRFISVALEAGDSCFVLATREHLDGLAKLLKARGVDMDRVVKKRRYVAVEALQVLEQLMVDGKLCKTRFDEFIREVFLPLKAAAESKLKRVAVCGEVVGLLWADGKPEVAIELERYWNEVARKGSYCLRCFYPIASFSDPGQNELFLKLCAQHASLIPHHTQLRDAAAGVNEFESSP